MNSTLTIDSPDTPAEPADIPIAPTPSELSEPAGPGELSPKRGWFRRVRGAIGSSAEWFFGVVALVIGLAVLSAMPVFQFLSFGYLLESGGRVARSGRWRDALIGVRRAARLGSMAIGAALLLLPLRFLRSWATSAELIDPGGPIARRWRLGLLVLSAVLVLQILAACARGGRLRDFFWPFAVPSWLLRVSRRGVSYTAARDAVWEFLAGLRLPHYFRLGLVGFVGTLAWLLIPVSLIALGRRFPLAGLLGGLLLAVVALALPFLQVRFVVENRFTALFEYRAVRHRFQRAPFAFAVAALLTLSFAVPLYLLKIEMIPRETAWLPSLVFLGFIVPARTLTGWAYARSVRRDQPRHALFRWTSRLVMLATGLVYALIVFFTQFTAWQGIWSLYEQHAFLLPVPFFNM